MPKVGSTERCLTESADLSGPAGEEDEGKEAGLTTITGPIVLVGHSYGGAVVTNAATGNRQVKALVYSHT